jgi:hypothetical protein
MHNKLIPDNLTKTPIPPIIPNSLSVEALWKVQRISGITSPVTVILTAAIKTAAHNGPAMVSTLRLWPNVRVMKRHKYI